MTCLALAAKCGGRGASGLRGSGGGVSSASGQSATRPSKPRPVPDWVRKERREIGKRTLITFSSWLQSSYLARAAFATMLLRRGEPRDARHTIESMVMTRKVGQAVPLHDGYDERVIAEEPGLLTHGGAGV